MNQKVWAVDALEVARELGTQTNEGLSDGQAQSRLANHGPNVLEEKGRRGPLKILLAQLNEVMVYILLAAGTASLLLHEKIDAIVIFVILALNTLLGFWQELRAERAMNALKEMSVPEVRVRRQGRETIVGAESLVPGDIAILEAGNLVPADGRILESSNLKIQEAALTGESEPVEKNADTLEGDPALADRTNMVHRGTVVTYGRCLFLVTTTGMGTELGKIASMLSSVEEEKTPLQKRLALVGQRLALLALGLIAIVAVVSLAQGLGWEETFLTAVSMAVAAIPEGLPAIVTIALALGAKRMLGRKALIRHLPAVETLGSVTVICSDKTGTLTQNRMTVTKVVLPGADVTEFQPDGGETDPAVQVLLTAGALCNDAVVFDDRGPAGELEALGDPTEGCLVIAAEKTSMPKGSLEGTMPRIGEFPFDSERKRMTTIHGMGRAAEGAPWLAPLQLGDFAAFTKGSVDGLMDVCDRVFIDGAVRPLEQSDRDHVLETNRTLAQNGIRVLGMAAKAVGDAEIAVPGNSEEGMIFLGMTGIIDPVRPEAVDAVATCQRAGIRPVMITGDHPLTAAAIGRELGIDGEGAVTGKDLDAMDDIALKKTVQTVSIFARVAPEHKMRIIDALQDQGEIVSMTGDGVNDAPALKSADIGVAMGITGTDVSKESSDMVLLDDNFATIVKAVREGRNIFDNIRKFIKYILSGNTGEIFVMLLGPLFGLPIALLPIQILWINLVTDGLPAIALGYEPAEKNVMERPPFDPKEGIFSRGLGRQILLVGSVVGLASLLAGFFGKANGADLGTWRTMVFTTLTFAQMAFAYASRSETRSFFATNPLTNPAMVLGIAMTFGLQLALVYVPGLQTVFQTTALTGAQITLCLAGAGAVVVVTEVMKLAKYLRRTPITTRG